MGISRNPSSRRGDDVCGASETGAISICQQEPSGNKTLGSHSRALPSSCFPAHTARTASQNLDPAAASKGARPSGDAPQGPVDKRVQQEPVTLVLSGDRGISAFSESDLFKQVGTTTERANYGGLRCSSPRSSPVVLLQRTHAPPLPQCGHPG